MLHVDLHTNIGLFPDSSDAIKKGVYISPKQLAKFIKDNNITHHLCLYPRDEYYLMEELQTLLPNVVHYGVQVIPGNSPDNPTDIKKVKLDILEPKKVLCKGIKLASHRGFWIRDEEVSSGLDYGVYSRSINHLLHRLPENCWVSMHQQGEPGLNSGSNVFTVSRFALKFPHLKFILNHAGDFGMRGMSAKPGNYIYPSLINMGTMFPAYRHAHSKALIQACASFAQFQHNIWLESSAYFKAKAEWLESSTKVGIGSDYPFDKRTDGFKLQERGFELRWSPERVQQVHEKSLHFLATDWKDLVKEHITATGFGDDLVNIDFTNLVKKKSHD